jgi:hypothetical protein
VTSAAPLDPDLPEYEGASHDQNGKAVCYPYSEGNSSHEEPENEPERKANAPDPRPLVFDQLTQPVFPAGLWELVGHQPNSGSRPT